MQGNVDLLLESAILGGCVCTCCNSVVAVYGGVADLDGGGLSGRTFHHIIRNGVTGQERGCDIAGCRELCRARWVELELAVAGSSRHGCPNGRLGLARAGCPPM